MKARESCRIGRAPSYAMPTNFLKALPLLHPPSQLPYSSSRAYVPPSVTRWV